MRVFVTGASGWIGSAVVLDLLSAGHHVLGLARSQTSADAISAAGGQPVLGDITDLHVLREAAAASDGVVHLAFRHDVAFAGDFDTALKSDHDVIATFGDALAGTDRPLVIASGVAGLKPGTVVTEHDEVDDSGAGGRIANERVALALTERGVRPISVRFAPTVHGTGDNGFMSLVVNADRQNKAAAYIGDGANRWPAVHRTDAARLVRLATETAPTGSILHAVAEEGIALRDIAETIGRGLALPTASITLEQAQQQFGFLAGFLALDTPASSAMTRESLGWQPTGPTLLEDLNAGHYYAEPTA